MIKYKDKVRVLNGFYSGMEGEAIAYNEGTNIYLLQLTDGNSIEVSGANVDKVVNNEETT